MHNMHNAKYVRCQLECVGVTQYIGVCIITRIMSHLCRIKSARGIWLRLGMRVYAWGKCIRVYWGKRLG